MSGKWRDESECILTKVLISLKKKLLVACRQRVGSFNDSWQLLWEYSPFSLLKDDLKYPFFEGYVFVNISSMVPREISLKKCSKKKIHSYST